MVFGLNEEQESFRESVLRYLEKEYDFAARCAIVDAGGYSNERWRDFARLGWLAAVFDEEVGGLGDAGLHARILMEAFGRHLVVEPFLWTAIVCGRLISDSDIDIDRKKELIKKIIGGEAHLALALYEADGDHDVANLSTRVEKRDDCLYAFGRKPVTPNGAIAQKYILAGKFEGDTVLALVDRNAAGVEVREYRSFDGQNVGDIAINDARINRGDILARGAAAERLLERGLDYGTAALCAEAVGSMSCLVEKTGAYLKVRVQYDQPLAKFQALQHRLANMYVACENARSITYAATAALTGAASKRARLVSAAKVQVFRSANFVGKQSVQLHGGMGVSEELDIAHHFKRLTMAALQFRDEGFHIRRFAAADTGA